MLQYLSSNNLHKCSDWATKSNITIFIFSYSLKLVLQLIPNSNTTVRVSIQVITCNWDQDPDQLHKVKSSLYLKHIKRTAKADQRSNTNTATYTYTNTHEYTHIREHILYILIHTRTGTYSIYEGTYISTQIHIL